MTDYIFPEIKPPASNANIPYKTEPPLNSGAVIQQSRTLIVGQKGQDPHPRAAILMGVIAELTGSRSILNYGVWLDATFPHVALISGKRGSGKSYDLGILAEGLCSQNDSDIATGTESFAMILFDTQNQFWTLGQNTQEQPTAVNWGIDFSELIAPTIFRPRCTDSVGDFETEFTPRPGDLEHSDWLALCGLERFELMGQCLIQARQAMPINFELSEMIDWISSDEAIESFGENTRNAVKWRLQAREGLDLFDAEAEDVGKLLATAGSKSVIQLADLDDETKSVVVSVILRKVMNYAGPAQRRRKIAKMQGHEVSADIDIAPRIWTLIDEAQLICPADGKTAANPVIVDYVKRGRDAGLSLVMATQQPSALDTSAVSQADLVITHKLTIESDIDAATKRMPAKMPSQITKGRGRNDLSSMSELARILDSGESVFTDSESDRAFILRSRPRTTPHGGGEPEF